jgi:hypothetical protein
VAWSLSKQSGKLLLPAAPPIILSNEQNRSNIGGIVCSVMMQQLNQKHPTNYLLAMRLLWIPIGLMIIFWIFVPESPWFHARRGNKEKALKAMRQLYGGVEGYDFEEEYGIIERTIEHERDFLEEAPKYVHVFKGLNLVSASTLDEGERTWVKRLLETYTHGHDPRRMPATWRSRYHQHLFYLYVASSSSAQSRTLMTNETDFFSLAGLKDPFLDTVILS